VKFISGEVCEHNLSNIMWLHLNFKKIYHWLFYF